jgi:mono/diheme cytochrome c family protein
MVALAACSAHSPGAHAPRPAADSPYNSLENGKRIFQTGRDLNGKSIVATHKPLRASCAACHGVNGAGGMRIKDNVVSADLRHRALVTDQKPPYTLPLLERAISQNIDNQGKPLDPVMPRWRLSQRDLHDVAEYVLTQLK